jgi:hypothetical protein
MKTHLCGLTKPIVGTLPRNKDRRKMHFDTSLLSEFSGHNHRGGSRRIRLEKNRKYEIDNSHALTLFWYCSESLEISANFHRIFLEIF